MITKSKFFSIVASGLLMITIIQSSNAQLVDAYPDELAKKLSDQREAELSATSKLSSQEASYLFSRKRWNPGSKILVAFNGGNAELHKAIVQQAELWEKYANIDLDFGYDATKNTYRTWSTSDAQRAAHIRIGFSQPGYWSYVGTDSVSSIAPTNAASMNFEGFADNSLELLPSRWKMIVIHEFGHALGLHHEHQHPACGQEFRWNTSTTGDPSVYEVFKKWQGWDSSKVDVNLRPMRLNSVYASSIPDKQSIMFYAMPAQAFIKGDKSSCFIKQENTSISKLDSLGAKLIYPKNPTQAFETARAYAKAAATLSSAPIASLNATERAAVRSRINSEIESKKPLLYVHIQREGDRDKATAIQHLAQQAGFFAPGIENVSKKGLKSGPQVEVRYFRESDISSAQQILSLLRNELGDDASIKVLHVKSLAASVTRNLVEVWLP